MATVEPMRADVSKTPSVIIKEGDQAILKKGKTVRVFQIRKKRLGMKICRKFKIFKLITRAGLVVLLYMYIQ